MTKQYKTGNLYLLVFINNLESKIQKSFKNQKLRNSINSINLIYFTYLAIMNFLKHSTFNIHKGMILHNTLYLNTLYIHSNIQGYIF